MNRTPRRRLTPWAAALAVGGILLLAGCSGADDSGGSGDSGSASSAAQDAGGSVAERPAVAADSAVSGQRSRVDVASSDSVAGKNRAPARLDVQQALIKHGTVELTSDDVGRTRFEVQKVVDRYGGQISEDNTQTGDDGDPEYARMVLRVPADRFDEAMHDLAGTADLVSSSTSEDDVTGKLIDTKTRLAVQRQSIDRISALFAQARSIREIMAIEAQLSRRQADLESLERRVAYLTNETTYSTITVNVDRTPAKKAAVAKDDDTGFVAGLKAGWSGLSTFAVAVATVLGALLPWLVLAAILTPPALLLARWIRRRVRADRTGRTPSAA